MYGGETGERAPRRRRRRPDETTDTGAHTIIERVNSESAKLQPIRDDTPAPQRTSHRQQRSAAHRQPEPPPRPAPTRSAPPPVRQPAPEPPPQVESASLPPQFRPPTRPAIRPAPEPPSRTDLPRPEQSRADLPRPDQRPPAPPRSPQPRMQPPPPAVAASEPTRPVPPPPRRTRRAEPPPQSMPSGTFPAPPPVDPDPYDPDLRPTTAMSPIGNGLAPEEVTEQIPRFGQPTGQHPVPFPPARANFGPSQAPPAPEQRNGLAPQEHRYPDEYADLDVDSDERQDYDFPEADDLDDLDDDLEADEYDDEDEDRASPGRDWLVMAGQVAISVIGGAGVWLGFNWLWGKLPQAALVAALAVIVGLVWIVRKIRRADDLQTTGLAVLVGLFVTVSPAALLLLSR